ncbi:MAG: hypothetical protein KY445_06425 [Armatimonadetes bacterium]|nr:hypothetical protein [Armatimonadota bacterium]
MATAHEDDVVHAFRQALEEELRRVQEGERHEPLLLQGASTEENLERLMHSHERLQSEVALLRTVILKLVSQPVDFENS